MRFSGSNEVFKALSGKSGGFVGAGMGAGRGKGKRHRFNVAGMKPPAKTPATVAPKIPSHGSPDSGTLLDNIGRDTSQVNTDADASNQNEVNPGVLAKAPKIDASKQVTADLDDSAMAELRKMNPKRKGK